MTEVAARFGVEPTAIRQRAKREGWLVPSRVSALKATQDRSLAVSRGVIDPDNPTKSIKAVDIVTESLDSIGTQLRHVVASKALSALRKADLASLPIDTWQDAKIAAEVGLKAAGLDNASGPSVNVLFGGTGFGSDPSPLIEIDAANFTSPADSDTEIL